VSPFARCHDKPFEERDPGPDDLLGVDRRVSKIRQSESTHSAVDGTPSGGRGYSRPSLGEYEERKVLEARVALHEAGKQFRFDLGECARVQVQLSDPGASGALRDKSGAIQYFG
jgi:hypothetical protein